MPGRHRHLGARERFVCLHGIEAWRERTRKDKQIQRLRRRLSGIAVSGKPADPATVKILHGGVWHPLDCGCADCLWGEVAEIKAIAAKPRGVRPEVEYAPARTGRVAR